MVAPEALSKGADKIPQGSRVDFFELRGALWKILPRPISVRTCQIVEEHSWQNLPVFPAGAELRLWFAHSLAEGKVIFAMWGKYK